MAVLLQLSNQRSSDFFDNSLEAANTTFCYCFLLYFDLFTLLRLSRTLQFYYYWPIRCGFHFSHNWAVQKVKSVFHWLISSKFGINLQVRALQPVNAPKTAYRSRSGGLTWGMEGDFFFVLIGSKKIRNGPASADQGCSTSSQGSCHVHGTSWLCPPTSPYPTFLASAKSIFKMDCANIKMWPKSDNCQTVSLVVKGLTGRLKHTHTHTHTHRSRRNRLVAMKLVLILMA